MLATRSEFSEQMKTQWHILNAAKGSRLMMSGSGYMAVGRGIPVDSDMVTGLLEDKLIERVGRGMYQLSSAGKYFVFNHKDEMALEVGNHCDDCHQDVPTTAVYRFNCRHHWVCDNCRQNADGSGR